MFKRSSLLVLLGLGLLLGAGACKKVENAAPASKNFSIVGEVQGFQADGKVVVIKHQKIEGLMDAMTMGFELADPKLGAGLAKGDKVSGVLTQNGDNYTITELKKQ